MKSLESIIFIYQIFGNKNIVIMMNVEFWIT